MSSAYTPVPGEMPGTVGPGGPEATLEWVKPAAGPTGDLQARLGSDPRADVLLLAVVASLHGGIGDPTWDALVDELPFALRGILRRPGQPVPRPAPRSAAELVAAVSRMAQCPPARTALEVRAVFGSLKRGLSRGVAEAVARELPSDLAAVWRLAR